MRSGKKMGISWPGRFMVVILAASSMLAGNFKSWAADSPLSELSPSKQVSIAESGLLKDIGAIGSAPGSYRYFTGKAVAFVAYKLPKLPEGLIMKKAELALDVNFLSSTKNTCKLIVGRCPELPENLTWENQPKIIEGTASEPVEVCQTGTVVVDVTPTLRENTEEILVLKLEGYKIAGNRWIWYKQNTPPILKLTSGR